MQDKKVLSEEERKARRNEQIRLWQKANPDKVREIKKRYYASDKGRAQKRKEDVAFVASGGRAQVEARRASKPISEARKASRRRWASRNKDYFAADRARRRDLVRDLSPCDFWVLQEAVALARLREKVVGGKWHVDHIVPVSKGGTSVPENIQVVPAWWNRSKSNLRVELFLGA